MTQLRRYTWPQRISAAIVCLAILASDAVWLVLEARGRVVPLWEVFFVGILSATFYCLAKVAVEGH